MKKKDNSLLSPSLSVEPGGLSTELGVEPFSRQVAQLAEALSANGPQVVQLSAALPENLCEREISTLGRIIQGRAEAEIPDELLLNSPTLGRYVRNVSDKIRVICFTDMKGSTDNIVRLGDAKALELLHTHDTIIRACLTTHNGSEIKRTGDGFLITFFVASDAIACAQAIQRSLAKHNREHPDTPISVRIGLNAGEPLFDEGDLFGAVVNAAARICKQTPPDQIFIAEVVCQLVAGKDFTFTDCGHVKLLGFREPFHLYAVQWKNEHS
jgi:class 3 adenylate cyclase